jgi:hypothetical protein
LVHLGAHPLAEKRMLRSALEELAHVGVQLPRLGMNDLELFFDADGELTVE